MAKRADWRRAIVEGRVWTAADAREVLAACERSGGSLAAFARRHGVSAQRLYWWRHRLTGQEAADGGEPRLIPVTVVEGAASRLHLSSSVAAVIEGELRIEVTDATAVSPAWIAALLRYAREGRA